MPSTLIENKNEMFIKFQNIKIKRELFYLGLLVNVLVFQMNCIVSFYKKNEIPISDIRKSYPIDLKIFVNSNISNAWTREEYKSSVLKVDNVTRIFSNLVYKKLKDNDRIFAKDLGDAKIEYQGIVKINYYTSIYSIIIQVHILGFSYGLIPGLLPMRHNIEIYFYNKSGDMVWYREETVDMMSYLGMPFVLIAPWYGQRVNYVNLYHDIIAKNILKFNEEINNK
ncbi:hypothetical protein [Leptospira interrogans]|uniref:hypothetical protein n=1 Tax=Leptospira interrogans TaxID=173 RepID=UPI0007741E32|nr:hypothetical protein [Leptospira interrogans]